MLIVFAAIVAVLCGVGVRLLIKRSDEQPVKSKSAVLLVTLAITTGLSAIAVCAAAICANIEGLRADTRFALCFVFLCASEVVCVPVIMAGYVAR